MMTYDRHLRMNFFFSHWMDYVTFGMRWPERNHNGFNLLLKPFSYQVWFLLITVFIVFIILNKFKIRILIPIRIVHHQNGLNSQQYRSSIDLNLLWINLSLLFRQPYYWLRYLDTSIKICVIFWTFSALILTTFYSGFISSILAIPIHDGITTVHQFAEQCESQNIIPLIRNNTSWANVFSVCILLILNHNLKNWLIDFFLLFSIPKLMYFKRYGVILGWLTIQKRSYG